MPGWKLFGEDKPEEEDEPPLSMVPEEGRATDERSLSWPFDELLRPAGELL